MATNRVTDSGYATATGASRVVVADAGTATATGEGRAVISDAGAGAASGVDAGWSALAPGGDTVTQSVPCACCGPAAPAYEHCWDAGACQVPYPDVIYVSFPDLSTCTDARMADIVAYLTGVSIPLNRYVQLDPGTGQVNAIYYSVYCYLVPGRRTDWAVTCTAFCYQRFNPFTVGFGLNVVLTATCGDILPTAIASVLFGYPAPCPGINVTLASVVWDTCPPAAESYHGHLFTNQYVSLVDQRDYFPAGLQPYCVGTFVVSRGCFSGIPIFIDD